MELKQLKYTIKIFGEGYTEWFYFDHLRTSNKFKFTIEPDMPQQSKSSYKKRLKLIDHELKKNIQERANAIFLITDLDDILSKPKELDEYHKKKEIYKNKGVIFIESHPCIEVWFWYHFQCQFKKSSYLTYDEIKTELRDFLPLYDKTEKYYCKNKKFRDLILTDLKNRENAIKNGLKSCMYDRIEGEVCNYSEMFKAIHYFRLLKKFCELDSILKESLRVSISLSLKIDNHKCMKIYSNKTELCTFKYSDKGTLKLNCGTTCWSINDTMLLESNPAFIEPISKLLKASI